MAPVRQQPAAAASGPDMNSTPLQTVTAGFLTTVVSQLSTRLLTFAINLLIALHLTPEAYALSAVQFHLLNTTMLLLSREGFRRGCLRLQTDPKDKRDASMRVLSVACLPIPVGLLVIPAVAAITLHGQHGDTDDAKVYRTAVLLHGVAAMLELLSEPFYILASVKLQFKVRVAAESIGTLTKTISTLLLVKYTSTPPALAFAYAQLLSSLGILSVLGSYGVRELLQARFKALRAKWTQSEWELLRMSGLFSLQAAEKLALGEGSKGMMVAFQSRYNQGVYGLVSNLGSLVVRVLLQPLEDVAFTTFSRFKAQQSQAKDLLKQQLQALAVLTKVVSLLGLLAVAFGPSYSYTLLRLVYSTKWSETEAPVVLAWYCVYILLLAVNGITEAFTHAVQEQRALGQSNAMLIAFTGAHIGMCWLLIPTYGAVGLVLADAANMALRILYSAWYIRRHFQAIEDAVVPQLLPARTSLVALAAAGAVTRVSERLLLGARRGLHVQFRSFMTAAGLHVGVGVICLALSLAAVYRTERQTIQQLLNLRRKGTQTADKVD